MKISQWPQFERFVDEALSRRLPGLCSLPELFTSPFHFKARKAGNQVLFNYYLAASIN
jgi:hypothetical protein